MKRVLLAGLLMLVAHPAFAQTPTPVTVASPNGLAPVVTVVARGYCDVDPSASLADGAETIVSCTASGVHAGMLVLAATETTSDVADVFVKRARAGEGQIELSFGSYGTTQNPGTLRIQYLVVQ